MTLFQDIKDAGLIVEDLLRVWDRLTIMSTRTIAEETINIAVAANISVYDASYMALTQKLNGTLYTADKKLAAVANTITTSRLLTINGMGEG